MSQHHQPAAILHVRVQPRASRNEVLGFNGPVLRVRVTAPPEAGRANDAVVALLAEALGVPRSRIRILRGHAARNKVVLVESLTQAEAARRLEAR
jgi:uncharacterized protein (TIGR00251 family)